MARAAVVVARASYLRADLFSRRRRTRRSSRISDSFSNMNILMRRWEIPERSIQSYQVSRTKFLGPPTFFKASTASNRGLFSAQNPRYS